ncbi:MAG: diguanylate cyclase [Lachnospira sp.]|nr:diguanylate cyclase [Lachnospira sp.]
MKERKMSGLRKQMLLKAIVPMLLLTVVITIMAFQAFTSAMEKEVKNELQYICDIFQSDFEEQYPGDVTKEGEGEVRIYKGGVLLNGKNELLDRIKNLCGIDVTVFYHDMRVLTSIKGQDEKRIIGTAANFKVEQDVIENGKISFYNNVTVNGEPFYGYYKPLYNSDGVCVGMIFAGKEAASVKRSISASILPLVLVAIAGMAMAGAYIISSSRKIVNRISALQNSLSKVSAGKLDGGIDTDILKLNDEISDIGRSVMHMQKALKELVELDALTKIYNRRSGENRLKDIIKKSEDRNTSFSIAIGDIDFFKKVNDTYGHDAGDIVLQQTARILKNGVVSHGFVSRWGGEEFLLVFERGEYEDCVEITKQIMEDIQKNDVELSDGTSIRVTMTFGITEVKSGEEIRLIFNRADTLLYYGKENGRSQVVTDQQYCDDET